MSESEVTWYSRVIANYIKKHTNNIPDQSSEISTSTEGLITDLFKSYQAPSETRVETFKSLYGQSILTPDILVYIAKRMSWFYRKCWISFPQIKEEEFIWIAQKIQNSNYTPGIQDWLYLDIPLSSENKCILEQIKKTVNY